MKHCSEHYRNIKGIKYIQYTDDIGIDIKNEKEKFPNKKFIKIKDRYYISVDNIKK
jgi:hypothetical protein